MMATLTTMKRDEHGLVHKLSVMRIWLGLAMANPFLHDWPLLPLRLNARAGGINHTSMHILRIYIRP